jgi:hypothetical protein
MMPKGITRIIVRMLHDFANATSFVPTCGIPRLPLSLGATELIFSSSEHDTSLLG